MLWFTKVGGDWVHSRSAGSALVLLAVTLAQRLSYTSGPPRMPGRRRPRQSAVCTNCNDGRLRKRVDGWYHCANCQYSVPKLPPRGKR
jgi:hypothetical protein